MKLAVHLIIFWWAIIVAPFVFAEFRSWTGNNGVSLEAELVRLESDGISMILRRRDGSLIYTRLLNLIAADQQYVRALVRANRRAATDTPRTPQPAQNKRPERIIESSQVDRKHDSRLPSSLGAGKDDIIKNPQNNIFYGEDHPLHKRQFDVPRLHNNAHNENPKPQTFRNAPKQRVPIRTDEQNRPRNNNPLAAWNNPVHRDNPLAPHNCPIDRDSPLKPWNSPVGSNDDLTMRERKAYGLPQNDFRKSYFSNGIGEEDKYPKNRNPFAAWNSPIHKNNPSAPHNNPIHKTSPFKPWNSPMGSDNDLTTRERRAYGLPKNNTHSPFNSGLGGSGY